MLVLAPVADTHRAAARPLHLPQGRQSFEERQPGLHIRSSILQEVTLANIFRLMKLARTAYKAAPVVVPIALAVAKYAKGKLEERETASSARRADRAEASQELGTKAPPRS